MVVTKARLELQRTEPQLKKRKHALDAQFERRSSEDSAEAARRQSALTKDGVVVQLSADREKSTRRMSRLSAHQHDLTRAVRRGPQAGGDD